MSKVRAICTFDHDLSATEVSNLDWLWLDGEWKKSPPAEELERESLAAFVERTNPVEAWVRRRGAMNERVTDEELREELVAIGERLALCTCAYEMGAWLALKDEPDVTPPSYCSKCRRELRLRDIIEEALEWRKLDAAKRSCLSRDGALDRVSQLWLAREIADGDFGGKTWDEHSRNVWLAMVELDRHRTAAVRRGRVLLGWEEGGDE